MYIVLWYVPSLHILNFDSLKISFRHIRIYFSSITLISGNNHKRLLQQVQEVQNSVLIETNEGGSNKDNDEQVRDVFNYIKHFSESCRNNGL